MDEIVQQVAQRTGLSDDKARAAVQAVFEQLDKRLPAPLASQLRDHLGGGAKGSEIGGLSKGLGGLFGS